MVRNVAEAPMLAPGKGWPFTAPLIFPLHTLYRTALGWSSSRRSLLLAATAVLSSAAWRPSLALDVALEGSSTGSFTTYTDPTDGFSLRVPAGWLAGEGALPGNTSFSGASGARRTLAWFPPDASPRDVNVTVTVTNVSVEFTRLGSLGSPAVFGGQLVGGQDRSQLLRAPSWARGREPIQVARLLDASQLGPDRYWVEYVQQQLPPTATPADAAAAAAAAGVAAGAAAGAAAAGGS
ncbi:hypothetical protein Agub_g5841, partial [Astrephomene gubernaculifera]